jgi:site-specific DNA-methyltransferase (adenine-specific)
MTTRLFHGDCLDILSSIEDLSVDLAFVDPPYNVGKDYGDYKDDLPIGEYLLWCKRWIKELKRISYSVAIYPPKKHLLWFWNQIPENYQIICAWSPEGAIRSGFVHQYIPLLVPPKPVKRTKDHWWNVQVSGLGYFYREEKFDHPGQTSLDITNRVIHSFSKPGDTILDCFMGTGTTGVICAKSGRNFIGIEQEKKWFDLAQKRIDDTLQQPMLSEATP